MSRPLSTSSATGRVPVWANSQSPRMDPRSSLRTPHRDSRQGHIDPSLLKETRLGSEPRGALPCRKQSRCDSDTLMGLLRPSQTKSSSWDGGGTRDQMQELPT
jgi:hypothetical protein